LIELLVVIAIIGMLIGILVPSIASALSSGYGTRTLTHMRVLEGGIDAYHLDHRIYPGQDSVRWGKQYRQINGLSATEHLVRCLFSDRSKDAFRDGWEPVNGYANVDEDLLDNEDGTRSRTGKPYVPLDGFPKPLTITYWPSITYRDQTSRFDDNCNSGDLIKPKEGSFNDFIEDPQSDRPFGYGRYLLIAPGPDRRYFTTDDITNFRRE
jgi:type II secretory pathway pseudopilin PulG